MQARLLPLACLAAAVALAGCRAEPEPAEAPPAPAPPALASREVEMGPFRLDLPEPFRVERPRPEEARIDGQAGTSRWWTIDLKLHERDPAERPEAIRERFLDLAEVGATRLATPRDEVRLEESIDGGQLIRIPQELPDAPEVAQTTVVVLAPAHLLEISVLSRAQNPFLPRVMRAVEETRHVDRP
jgi:hypothetical protein